MLSIEAVAARFHGVQKEGHDKFKALCPVHDDHKPSVGIWMFNGRICVKCRSRGCDKADILKAVGLTRDDLGRGWGEPVAVYEYRDATGKRLYWKKRYVKADGSKATRPW